MVARTAEKKQLSTVRSIVHPGALNFSGKLPDVPLKPHEKQKSTKFVANKKKRRLKATPLLCWAVMAELPDLAEECEVPICDDGKS